MTKLPEGCVEAAKVIPLEDNTLATWRASGVIIALAEKLPKYSNGLENRRGG